MGIRQWAGLLAAFAAGGLVAAFAGSGSVSATFEQAASAGVSVGVGTFGCALSAATGDGATANQSGNKVSVSFYVDSPDASGGTASVDFTLTNTGSMPVHAEWGSLTNPGDSSTISAALAVAGGGTSSELPAQGNTVAATLTFTWGELTSRASLDTGFTVSCTEGHPVVDPTSASPLRHSPRALTAPAPTGFRQDLNASAAIDVAPPADTCAETSDDGETGTGCPPTDPQCDPAGLDEQGNCPDDPQCDESAKVEGVCPPDPRVCTTGTPDASGNCQPASDPTCTGNQVLKDGACVDPPAPDCIADPTAQDCTTPAADCDETPDAPTCTDPNNSGSESGSTP